MNKRMISILFVIFFFIFIAVMDYPFIAQIINERKQTTVTMDYQNRSKDLREEERERYRLEAVEYNRILATGLAGNKEVPFPVPGTDGSLYMNLLNVKDDGVMGIVEIPKIEVSIPIYHGTMADILEEGAGHIEGTSLPVGGIGTHACIAAHRGLPTKKMFTNLDQIRNGDIFYVEVLGERLAYQVYDVEIVLPEEQEPLKIQKEKDLITLITCTPYGVNSHRIYVHGSRIPIEEARKQDTAASPLESFLGNYWWIILTVVVLAWMTFLLCWFNKKPKTKGRREIISELE